MKPHPDDEPEDESIEPGDPEEWQDYLELQHDRDDDFADFLEGLDYLDDIFDYPDDDDWYSE
jgi:hypothetical protein